MLGEFGKCYELVGADLKPISEIELLSYHEAIIEEHREILPNHVLKNGLKVGMTQEKDFLHVCLKQHYVNKENKYKKD